MTKSATKIISGHASSPSGVPVSQAMTASAVDGLRLVEMSVGWLDAIGYIEARAYPYPWTRGNFIDSMASGYHCVCLLDEAQSVRGYMVAMDGVDEVHLLNITVAPQYQGQGLARRMLDALVDRARSLAFACVWLEVRPSNERAHVLYRRYGFERVGVRRGYYPDLGGQREDALVMRYGVPAAPAVPGGSHAVD